MSRLTPLPNAAFAEVLGDVRALAATLGQPSDDRSMTLPPVERRSAPTTVIEWRRWVDEYFREVLVAHEGSLIVRAHGLTLHGWVRELVALDQAWGRTRATLPVHFQFLGEASSRVGKRQLSQLRPLRDQRLVLRYLAAIDAGEAGGWHPLVYGVVLALFALPLRQGLVHYSRQTAAGFLLGTPLAEDLSEARQNALLDEVTQAILPALQQLLPPTRWTAS